MATTAGSRLDAALEGLGEAVREAIAAWNVPGASVAVVSDSEVLSCEGFGLRDVAHQLPVTPDTVFAIGSTTKAFTTTALGILVDEGKLEWDTPIRRYMPAFTLHDVVASERATTRDLVCQRMGLPRYDLMWYGGTRTRRELFDRLRYLEPNSDFRSTWQYNNLMYMTAGVLIEEITGKTWEEFVRERILEPLGMTSATLSTSALTGLPDVALPHAEKEGTLSAIPFRNLAAAGPAGSINASVRDMTVWLRLQLSGGMHEGRQIIAADTLAQLHTPQMVVQMPSEFPEMVHAAYGLGWLVQPYRGHNMIWHNGGIDGFYALIAFLPVEKVGVVVLTNLAAHPMPEVVAYGIFDRVLGAEESSRPKASWAERMKEVSAKAKEEQEDAQEKTKTERNDGRVKGTQPSHPLESFAGEYEHPGYGALQIRCADGLLLAEYHGITAQLEHYHYDMFMTDKELGNLMARFTIGLAGDVESVSLPLQSEVRDIVFKRKPEIAPT